MALQFAIALLCLAIAPLDRSLLRQRLRLFAFRGPAASADDRRGRVVRAPLLLLPETVAGSVGRTGRSGPVVAGALGRGLSLALAVSVECDEGAAASDEEREAERDTDGEDADLT